MFTWKKYFTYQADYQHWANDVLFNSLDMLDDAARKSAQGLFFDSAHNTVDHILVVTKNWMARLRQEDTALPYNKVHCPDWKELKNALRQEVRDMQRWLEACPDEFFEERLFYRSSNGKEQSIWVRDALTHIMTHMVHHRGQVSAVATRLGSPTPEMDYVYYKREMEEHLENIKK